MFKIVYDTETTGLPKDWKARVHDVDNWPRIVQLAWAVIDEDFSIRCSRSDLISIPEDVEISQEALDTHGFSRKLLALEGVPIEQALEGFSVAMALCGVQVGHNLNFDRKVIGAEFIRAGREWDYEYMEDRVHRICTMMSSTKVCGLRQKNGRGLKWPSLGELHLHLFGKEFDGAHNAYNDVLATIECFKALLDEPKWGGYE